MSTSTEAEVTWAQALSWRLERQLLADGDVIKAFAFRGSMHYLSPEDGGAYLALRSAVREQGDMSLGPPRDGQPTFQRLDDNPRWQAIPDLDEAGPRAIRGDDLTVGWLDERRDPTTRSSRRRSAWPASSAGTCSCGLEHRPRDHRPAGRSGGRPRRGGQPPPSTGRAWRRAGGQPAG